MNADLLKQASIDRFDNAVRNVDDSYISTFENAANDFRSTSQTAYEGMNWGNSSQITANRRIAQEDLDFRQSVIRSWLEKNKSSIGEDRYRSVSDVLDAYRKDSTNIMRSFDDAVRFYSQWKTEDLYKKDAKNIGNQNGIDDKAKSGIIDHSSVSQITNRYSYGSGIEITGHSIEGIIMKRNTLENRILERQTFPVETVGSSAVQFFAGCQQVQSCIVGWGIAAGIVAQLMIEPFHSVLVPLIDPECSGIGIHQISQPVTK